MTDPLLAVQSPAPTPGPVWVVMPFIDCWDFTLPATDDVLMQSVPTRLLLIDQGSSKEVNDQARRMADRAGSQVLFWSFNPPLPSLSAVWNRALDFVWAVGGSEALVVNNDVRLHRQTVEVLQTIQRARRAWFVSGVGVREGQFIADLPYCDAAMTTLALKALGGPDFSCFLLTREGHQSYRFDEAFIPAYHEDLDCHRRYMLGGHGDKIFGAAVPFLHYASRTVNRSPEAQAAFHQKFAACRAYYERKWGPPNAETYWTAFGMGEAVDTWGPIAQALNGALPTTPALQAYWRERMRQQLQPAPDELLDLGDSDAERAAIDAEQRFDLSTLSADPEDFGGTDYPDPRDEDNPF